MAERGFDIWSTINQGFVLNRSGLNEGTNLCFTQETDKMKWFSGFFRERIVSLYEGHKGIKNSLRRYSLENFFQDDQIGYREQIIFTKCLGFETLMEVSFASGCSPTI